MTGPIPAFQKTDWLTVALLFAAGLLAAAQFGKISLTLHEFVSLTGLPITTLAILVSVVGLVGLVGGVMAGAVVASLGPRRVLSAALVLGAAMSFAQAVLPPFPIMLGLRVIEGVSHLGLVVAAPPIMAQISSDRDRPIVMSIWAMFFGLSFAIAAVIFPPILGAGGLPLLFALHGAALLVLAFVLVPKLDHSPQHPLKLNPITAHLEAYSNPRTVAPGLGFCFYTVSYVALLTLLPNALSQPELAVSLPIISLLGTLAAGWIARYVSPHWIAVAGFAMAIVGAIGTLFAYLGAEVVLFLAMGVIPGASFAMIPHLNPNPGDQARATGAIAQLGNLGTVTGTPIFALTLSMSGLFGMLLAVMGFSLAGILTVLLLQALVKRKS